VVASSNDDPQKYDSIGTNEMLISNASIGLRVGTSVAGIETKVRSMSAQEVYLKHVSPGTKHSASDPELQGLVQSTEASSNEVPQKKVSSLIQGVYPKHCSPVPSHSFPTGHGLAQESAASSHVEPQKNEPLSSQGVLAKQACPVGHSLDAFPGHGTAQLEAASSNVDPQKNEPESSGTSGGDDGSLQVVCVKHDSPNAHSLDEPDGQGRVHDEASSKLLPHMKESLLSHVVYGKQKVPLGQSLDNPDSHGKRQFDEAWFQVVPQKYELVSSHGVPAKQEYSKPSSEHSVLDPLGQALAHSVEASVKFLPQ
jgi:hypothetical protein